MAEAASETACWWRALTLTERAGLLRHLPATRLPAAGDDFEVLQAWRKQAPFGEGGWLRRRLALVGLDEESFPGALLGSPELLQSLQPDEPPWMIRMKEPLAADYRPEDVPMMEEAMDKDPIGGFLRLVSPLLSRGLEALRRDLRAARSGKPPAALDSQSLERHLFAALPGRLTSLLDRTLV